MPEIVILTNQHIEVVKTREPRKVEGSDAIETVEVWTLVLTDRTTQKQLRCSVEREARDDIVRQFTDGIVLAGGDLPNLRG